MNIGSILVNRDIIVYCYRCFNKSMNSHQILTILLSVCSLLAELSNKKSERTLDRDDSVIVMLCCSLLSSIVFFVVLACKRSLVFNGNAWWYPVLQDD